MYLPRRHRTITLHPLGKSVSSRDTDARQGNWDSQEYRSNAIYPNSKFSTLSSTLIACSRVGECRFGQGQTVRVNHGKPINTSFFNGSAGPGTDASASISCLTFMFSWIFVKAAARTGFFSGGCRAGCFSSSGSIFFDCQLSLNLRRWDGHLLLQSFGNLLR